ncbi:MAG: hypothetical protein V7731_16195 [Amphritea sp.]
MKSTLSKTINIKPVTEITLLVQAFDPIAHAFCLQLQRQGMVGRKLKIGVKDNEEWQGAEFDFIVWQYDKLIEQIGGNLAVMIDWTTVDAIHLSVSGIVPKEDVPHLGNPDLVAG